MGDNILEYISKTPGLKVKRINTPVKRSSLKSLPKLKKDRHSYCKYHDQYKRATPINSKKINTSKVKFTTSDGKHTINV